MAFGGDEARADGDWIASAGTGRILTTLSLAVAVGLIVLVGVRWYAYQWDFHMFYGAARDFAAGIDPYRGQGLSFYHPPLMLYVYRLFTVMPIAVALTLWYLLKVAALAGLIWIWHSDFVRLRWQAPTILFFLFAYQAAIYSDLVAGNVSIFEELLLWLAFASLLRARYFVFAVCVMAVAQVKLTPIFFSVLLLIVCDRPQWRWFVATVTGFAVVFSCNAWLQPGLFRSFWIVSAELDERGDNTSLLALIRDVSEHFLGSSFTIGSRFDEVLFVTAALGILLITGWRILGYRRLHAAVDQRLLICLSCFVFALISPRFKGYTHILLLAPTLYFLRVVEWRGRVPVIAAVLLVLVLFPAPGSSLPFRYAFQILNSYLSLFAVAAFWLGYLTLLDRRDRAAFVTEKSSILPPAGLAIGDKSRSIG
jgi:hypothetical protein